MFHYRHKHLKSLTDLVESVSKYEGKPFVVESIDEDQYFCTLTGRFRNTRKEIAIEEIIDKIAIKLKLTSNDVYIRNNKDGSKRIIIPTNIAKAQENYFGI